MFSKPESCLEEIPGFRDGFVNHASYLEYMKRALVAILVAAAGGLGLLVNATPPHVAVIATTHDCWVCFHHRR